MLGLSLRDVVWDILIVGGVVGFVVSIAANAVWDRRPRPENRAREATAGGRSETAAPRTGWMVRKWLYFLGSLTAAIFALFVWLAFWYPLVQASSVAGLSSTYQALIPPVSAFMFLGLAMYLFDWLLQFIINFELEFGGQAVEVRKVLSKFLLPFIGVTGALVLLISSVVGFLMVLENLALTPGRLMSWIYGVILAATIIWLAFTFLTTSPFVLQAFRSSAPENKGE